MNVIEMINLCSEHWAGFMFYCVIESTVVFLLLGGLWLLLRKRAWVSAQFGYFLFLLVLVKLVVPGPISAPYLLSSFLPQKQIDTSEEGTAFGPWWDLFGAGVGGQRDARSPASPQQSTPVEVQPGPALSVSSVLMLGWATVVVAFLIRFVWVGRRTRRMFRQTTLVQADQVRLDLGHLQRIAGVKQKVRWVTGPWVKAPMAYGLVRPAVAVPEDMSQRYTPSQIRWILLHELAHIRRADALVSSLQRILQILFFFHPVLWWANAIIDQLREFACDDAALAGSSANRKDCGEGFLSIVFQTNGLPTVIPATLGMINYKTTIRRRLMRILDNERRLDYKLSFSAGVFVLAMTLLVLPFGARVAIAQVAQWTKLDIDRTNSPPSRALGGMVYDSVRGVVVLHGGATGSTILRDTWEWDGETWTQVSTTGPRRYWPGMAFDPDRGVAVLYGGRRNATDTVGESETWEWDGEAWKQVETVPGNRLSGPAMAYDPKRKTVIRHGGFAGSRFYGDTWEWGGQTWTQLADGPIRGAHQIVYDSMREKIVLFGGIVSRAGSAPNDTWEFDGTNWNQVSDAGPTGRMFNLMGFDSSRGVTVLFGGRFDTAFGFSGNLNFDDTWEWDGTQWSEVDTGLDRPVPKRSMGNMAYDSGRKRITLFGGATGPGTTGFADTWVYGATPSGMPKSLWSLY